MTIATSLRRYFEVCRAARRRRHTQRIVSSLPPEIRRDIGWQGAYPSDEAGFNHR